MVFEATIENCLTLKTLSSWWYTRDHKKFKILVNKTKFYFLFQLSIFLLDFSLFLAEKYNFIILDFFFNRKQDYFLQKYINEKIIRINNFFFYITFWENRSYCNSLIDLIKLIHDWIKHKEEKVTYFSFFKLGVLFSRQVKSGIGSWKSISFNIIIFTNSGLYP